MSPEQIVNLTVGLIVPAEVIAFSTIISALETLQPSGVVYVTLTTSLLFKTLVVYVEVKLGPNLGTPLIEKVKFVPEISDSAVNVTDSFVQKVILSFNDEFRTVAGKDAILMFIGSESTKHPSAL